MSDFKPGDLVEIIDDSNGDTEKGAIGRFIKDDPDERDLVLCEFADYSSWYVRISTLKKLSRLFPKPITRTDGTPA